ncbi:MAG: hypothetical protein EOO88_17780 [Pedobacter sp.]|nr:MAG: hypothetical protein EOO88_17780 [Pedobacter sp.]
MKNIKFVPYSKLFLILFTVSAAAAVFGQQRISPYLIGQNAWERNAVFSIHDEVKAVHFQMIRIGGNGYENPRFVNTELIKLIDYVRSVGAEPIVQLPRQLKNDDLAYKAIERINGELGKKIKFWSIGNEPDHHNQLASADEVYDFFTKISAQIKRFDPDGKILGVDLASYKPEYINRLIGGDLDLTGKIPGHNYYYLDVFSFHGYRFRDITTMEANVANLKKRLKPINSGRPKDQQLAWAITEFNSHWLVDRNLDAEYWPFTFHNGQVFAEMYDLGMREGAFTICPWSLLEGGADREGTDLSMFDLINKKIYPRSNYYHTQMIAHNFRKNYLMHHENQDSLTVIPMGDEQGISVMLLNKSKSRNFDYKIDLNGRKKSKDEKSVSVRIDARVPSTFNSSIDAQTTQMLIFDMNGLLKKKYVYNYQNEALMEGPKITVF